MPCGVPTSRCLVLFFIVIPENIGEALEIHARIDDTQALTKSCEGTHDNMQRDITPGFKIGDGLATATHAVGHPTLGVAAGFALGVVRRKPGLALGGLVAYGVMSSAYAPTVRQYRLPVWRALTLPLAGMLYTAMTIDSALRHVRQALALQPIEALD